MGRGATGNVLYGQTRSRATKDLTLGIELLIAQAIEGLRAEPQELEPALALFEQISPQSNPRIRELANDLFEALVIDLLNMDKGKQDKWNNALQWQQVQMKSFDRSQRFLRVALPNDQNKAYQSLSSLFIELAASKGPGRAVRSRFHRLVRLSDLQRREIYPVAQEAGTSNSVFHYFSKEHRRGLCGVTLSYESAGKVTDGSIKADCQRCSQEWDKDHYSARYRSEDTSATWLRYQEKSRQRTAQRFYNALADGKAPTGKAFYTFVRQLLWEGAIEELVAAIDHQGQGEKLPTIAVAELMKYSKGAPPTMAGLQL